MELPTGGVRAALIIAILAIAFYFAVALPLHDRAKLQLEREKFELEQKEKNAKEAAERAVREERAKARDDANTEYLDCLASSERQFNKDLELNGKPVPGKVGVYSGSNEMFGQFEKRQKERDDGCRKEYEIKVKISDSK